MTAEQTEDNWGRVLICGGTDCAGDLNEPYILRSLCHIKVTKVLSGCAANYGIAIDVSKKGIVPHDAPMHVSPRNVGLGNDVKWVGGAAGRSHWFLLDSKGGVWGSGNNVVGQLGLVETLERIPGPWTRAGEKVVQVTAGHTFSLFLTDAGKVYACGSSEHGQLGNGTTGERLVKAGKTSYDVQAPPHTFEGKKIAQISSGNQHSLALDEDGNVYAWGYAGYARLGLGDQKDQLVPTLVPQFSDSNPKRRAETVICGPTNVPHGGQVEADGRRLDGIAVHDVQAARQSCKIQVASLGGCTHFITTPTDDGTTQTVGFGQGALYGELYQADSYRSPGRHRRYRVSFGSPDQADTQHRGWSILHSLPRQAQPAAGGPSSVSRYCRVRGCVPGLSHEEGDESLLLECQKPYHCGCLTPPLTELPDGEWFCPVCEKEGESMEQQCSLIPDEDAIGEPELPDTPLKRKTESEERATPESGYKRPRSG
ncbi:hypothetical protein A1Q1_02916 [Trichosporon asahii var. asahii CBS 2479]|uniref:PHD-type domain-containing protein n=1 Tax=Trichosporon asahii var. asahii (strain ATCC 90039 / CBS 2479 / JCM 2466 / KCTC 7840 / NBRC 103889/ NCYC 2677 / UAMH 7654) TaxID=1186058 RepID=J5SXV1_TRIAS|nr:hypothetical protein A1Q1_02916 [Trichosporon asahii var. asahii CBS 2479]EJT48106.1 hypothetical protein A1Q1_02916 [Trichosporon asahii var. asahii CBS 2479]